MSPGVPFNNTLNPLYLDNPPVVIRTVLPQEGNPLTMLSILLVLDCNKLRSFQGLNTGCPYSAGF